LSQLLELSLLNELNHLLALGISFFALFVDSLGEFEHFWISNEGLLGSSLEKMSLTAREDLSQWRSII
jgi:hypothetical protein